jgi:hypothetical protein
MALVFHRLPDVRGRARRTDPGGIVITLVIRGTPAEVSLLTAYVVTSPALHVARQSVDQPLSGGEVARRLSVSLDPCGQISVAHREALKSLFGLHEFMAANVVQPGDYLACRHCDHTEELTPERATQHLADGWPLHCADTMIWRHAAPEAIHG